MPRQLGFGNAHIESIGQSTDLPTTSSVDTASEDIARRYRSDRQGNVFRRQIRSAPVATAPQPILADIASSTLTTVDPPALANPLARVRPIDNPQVLDSGIYDRVDTLQLSNNTINGTGFSTSSLNGFSSQRPEIIALIDYEPVFTNQSELRFNDTGYFIDYKYQTNQLRKETVQKLYTSLSANQTTSATLNEINVGFNRFVTAENSKLNIFQSVISIFDLFDKAFQVREIHEEFFRINNLQNIKDFFVKKMGFSETSYNTFSDTKILYQLLFDLRSASEDYSVNLLNLTDPNRTNDLNSVIVDTTYTKTNGFSFGLKSIKTPLNSTITRTAVTSTNYGNFLNSLPDNPTDRIKLLMQVLNRVLRVSRGLSKPEVRNAITTNFSRSDDDNPFDNIIGAPPRDIFTQPLGINTIGSSLYLTNTANPGIIVLPFENTNVDDGETTYVPGNLFFKNLTIQNSSIAQLTTYAEDLSQKIANTDSVYTKIFDFYDFKNKLLPNSYSKKFLNAVKNSLNYINTSQTNGAPSKESLIIPALLNLAQSDKVLKHYLFQFVLLLGLSSIENSTERSIFRNLKLELKTTAIFPDLDNFQEVVLNSEVNQSAILRSAALSMARTITNYVADKLVTPLVQEISLNENMLGNIGGVALDNPMVVIENKDQIASTLTATVYATFSNQPNLLKDFVDIAVALDQDAMISNSSDTYLTENLFTTKYSNVSLSYILAMLFEIISSFTLRFFDVNFDTGNSGQIRISYNRDNCLAAGQGIEKTISNIDGTLTTGTNEVSLNSPNTGNSDTFLNFRRSRSVDSYYDASRKIVEALVGEEDFLKISLGIFGIISTNLSNAKRIGIDVFNKLTAEQKSILRLNPNLLRKSQYRIASSLIEQLRSVNSLLDPFAFSVTEDEYNHLLTLNNTLKTQTNERTKILTVGLPNGIIDALNNKGSKTNAISVAEQITDIKGKEELIYLAVYRKSLLFEDLKFKPKKFLFDLGLFASTYPDNLTIDPFGLFDEQSGLITLKDKKNVNQENSLTKSNINTYSKYITYLSNAEKQELFNNHVKDYLFSKYNTLLTGLKLTDDVFPINAYSNYVTNNDQINQLLRLYLTTLGINDTRPIRQILADSRIDVAIRDALALMQNSMIAFKGELTDQIIFSEKMFDRIFNIQVNIDKDFEIDAVATPSNVLNNEYIASRLFKVGNKLFIKDLEGAILDEFYVSVEAIG